jgi:hypothetical protein
MNTKQSPVRARLLLSILLSAPALCACPHDGASELPPGELPEEEIQASADPAIASPAIASMAIASMVLERVARVGSESAAQR